jgi:hypothetical protein
MSTQVIRKPIHTFLPDAHLRLTPADVASMWDDALTAMPYVMTYGENGGLTTYAPAADFILRVVYTQPEAGVNYGVVTAHRVPSVYHDWQPGRGAAAFIDAIRKGDTDL